MSTDKTIEQLQAEIAAINENIAKLQGESELVKLQNDLGKINGFIEKLASESETAKADPGYPKTLGVYTRLKETYKERIAALVSPKSVAIPSIIEPVIEVVQDELLPDIALTEVKKSKK